jgi:hypothetical protein
VACFYRLAHKRERRKADRRWPYEIAVCFEGVRTSVMFSEGVGGLASESGTFSAAEALDPRWQRYFDVTDAAWLRPYLERMAAGEQLDAEKVVSHYVRLHGHPPRTFEEQAS